jgi:RsiW-degrading membrane proteinase PrsW (M82 family)
VAAAGIEEVLKALGVVAIALLAADASEVVDGFIFGAGGQASRSSRTWSSR